MEYVVYKEEVIAFFGPCCDYAVAPIGRQVTFWNIPLLTAAAMASDFRWTEERPYSMLTRVGPNFNSLTDFIINTLHHFNWKKLMLVYDSFGKHCHIL